MARRSDSQRLRMTDLAGPAVLWVLSLVVAVIAASTPAPSSSRGDGSRVAQAQAQAPVVVAARR